MAASLHNKGKISLSPYVNVQEEMICSGFATLPKAFTHHKPSQHTSLLDVEVSSKKGGIVPGKGCAEAEAAVRPLLQVLGRRFRRQLAKHVPQLR